MSFSNAGCAVVSVIVVVILIMLGYLLITYTWQTILGGICLYVFIIAFKAILNILECKRKLCTLRLEAEAGRIYAMRELWECRDSLRLSFEEAEYWHNKLETITEQKKRIRIRQESRRNENKVSIEARYRRIISQPAE